MLRAFTIVLMSTWLAWASAGDDSREARMWLQKMAAAVKTLNYEGTFVYMHDNKLEALRIVHRNDGSGERERLFSLAGSAREILRTDDLLTCILPDSKSVVVEKSRTSKYIPLGLLQITKDLANYYEFELLGQDRMAGMQAQVIAIKPKDAYRYGYRLWLERETGMLLKSDVLNEDGKAVEQLMFTNLVLQPQIPEEKLKPATSGKDFTWHRAEQTAEPPQAEAKAGRWKVTRLPGGFAMSMHKEHGLPTSRMPVDHMVFTDGLSSISVFIEKRSSDVSLPRGVTSMGAVNAYGTSVAGHHVTVMGEVPKAAVIMIGRSVRRKSQ